MESGYQLDTHDICAPKEADVVWFMDLPRKKKEFERVRRSIRKGTRLVLQILESPLLFPAAFVAENRRNFDAVVSFEFDRDQGRNFTYRLPVETEPQHDGGAFAERKLAVMVNTNRVEGWFSTRKKGWVGLPGIGGYFSGWKMPRCYCLRPAKGQLYSWRRRLAREAEKRDVGDFDIFGPGWRGEAISWCRPLHTRVYRCHQAGNVQRDGRAEGQDKRAWLGNYRFVIASENFRGKRGYISEKIFDAMLGDSVPVYLGEERISSYVSKESFVDARDFRGLEQLWNHLEGMTETEWHAMRCAGKKYLASEAFRPFTSPIFAQRMMEVLEGVKAAWSKGQESEDR